jgi:outer membrane protein TolC
MQRLYKRYYFFLFICFIYNAACSQDIYTRTNMKDIEIAIPPLHDIIDSAINYNAAIKFRKLDIKAKNANFNSEKNYWLRNMGLQADTRYGTFDNFSTNNNGLSTSIFNTTSRQLNYGLGVYLKFPIVDIIDRKNQLKRAGIEVEQSKMMAEQQEQEIRQLVIQKYHELILKQRLLNIQALAMGNARTNMEMVETGFRNGTISVTEYVRISDIVTRVETDFEKAKTDFITAKMILEDIAGFTFTRKRI